ncbi:MAG: DNA-binding response regulator [Deltaproteobacteria bacterium HGW-Deltaproteobacteria-24]|nr:MAG: DNA-binding response regulator [Deltaproteobacteria bacterium HGW-Deltaproteobacteria-24]
MVEDDPELAVVLAEYLKQFNMEVTNFEEPFLALSSLKIHSYDLVILDLTLPGMDGLEVCKAILKEHDIPIIISSARSDITDKVTALQLGADDYLPKPYNPRELSARIKAILKRSHPEIKEESVPIFQLKLDDMQILFQGKLLDLTMAEFDILKLLVQRKGGVVSREDFIYDSFHIEDESSLKNIDVMISRIRNKIAHIDDSQTYIKSVRGIGYQLVV